MSQLFEDVQHSLHGIAIAPRGPLVKVTLMKVISMDFNFDRRTKELCCAAFIDRKIDHGMYNSFYLDILKVVNTLQLVYDFGERV